MFNRRLLTLLFLSATLARVAVAEADETGPLEFKRLDLLDGRKLRNVVVRTYDARTDRVLLVTDKKAITIAAGLIPAPFADRVRKNAPSAGTSVSNTTSQQPPPTASGQPRDPNAPSSQTARAQTAGPQEHQTAAIDRALSFYRYEFKAGSDAIRVASVRVDARQPVAVTGWPGRYRTQGTAFLEIFDTKGWSATRATSTFEVITEQKPNEPVTVLDFTRKS